MILVAVALGYLLGTFPSARLAAGIATSGRVDLRRDGSRNPGGLNAMRQIGTAWGVGVILIDVAKGASAGLAGMLIAGDVGAYAAATASIAGHIFPVWAGFRGGKGVATSAGACLAVFPVFAPIDVAVAALGTIGTRRPYLTIRINAVVWVVAAALWWALALPNLWGPSPGSGLLVFSVLGAAMILGKFHFEASRAGSGR